MKNIIFIDIDIEREQQIILSKPPETAQPTTQEEATKMIVDDIACLCESLCYLIDLADQNGYAKREDLVRHSITHLNNLLPQ